MVRYHLGKTYPKISLLAIAVSLFGCVGFALLAFPPAEKRMIPVGLILLAGASSVPVLMRTRHRLRISSFIVCIASISIAAMAMIPKFSYLAERYHVSTAESLFFAIGPPVIFLLALVLPGRIE